MELGARIKEHRTRCGISQEDLARRVYVARQTVSNWETDKTYPDVQSLLLLAETFGTSIDELVKGDLHAMKETIDRDARRLNRLGMAMVTLIVIGAAAFVALSWALPQPSGLGRLSVGELAGAAAFVPLFACGRWRARGAGATRIKREHDLVTYREVAAYLQGEGLPGEGRPLAQAPRRRHRRSSWRAAQAAGLVLAAAVWAALSLLGQGVRNRCRRGRDHGDPWPRPLRNVRRALCF